MKTGPALQFQSRPKGLDDKVIARRESLWLEQRGNLELSVDKGVEIAAVVFDSLAMTR